MFSCLRSKAAPSTAPIVSPEPSILAEYAFFPFYDFIVQFYPTSWTPNKVTLVGVFMTLLSSLLLLSSLPADFVFIPDYPAYLPYSWFAPWCTNNNASSKMPLSSSSSSSSSSTSTYNNNNINIMNSNTATASTTTKITLYPNNIHPYFSNIFTPATMFLFCGLCNLIYCIADNTDGRLARRDKKTSGIGEYLDHGLDCVTSLLSTCVTCLSFSLPPANMSVAVVLIGLVTVFSHTLHYEKNIFIWGNRFASVDEAMIMFGLHFWLFVAYPGLGNARIPFHPAITNYLGDTLTHYLHCMNVSDFLYIGLNLAQIQTIVNITLKNAKMLFRLHIWCAIVNSLILLSLLPLHNRHVRSALPSTSIIGYTIGPFNYVSVWCITVAATLSIIAHIPIATQCAHQRFVSWTPLLGLVFVWISFAAYPVLGLFAAVLLHVVQILYNIHHIEQQYEKRQKKSKQSKLLANGNRSLHITSKKSNGNGSTINNNNNNNNKKKEKQKKENGIQSTSNGSSSNGTSTNSITFTNNTNGESENNITNMENGKENNNNNNTKKKKINGNKKNNNDSNSTNKKKKKVKTDVKASNGNESINHVNDESRKSNGTNGTNGHHLEDNNSNNSNDNNSNSNNGVNSNNLNVLKNVEKKMNGEDRENGTSKNGIAHQNENSHANSKTVNDKGTKKKNGKSM